MELNCWRRIGEPVIREPTNPKQPPYWAQEMYLDSDAKPPDCRTEAEGSGPAPAPGGARHSTSET